MQVVLLLLGTLVLSSLVLTVSADTEIYSEKLNLHNKKKILFTGKKTEDLPSELTGEKTFRDEANSLLPPQEQVESGRSSFLGLGFDQHLKDKCSGKSSFNIPLLNTLLTSNGLGPLTGTSTLTTDILNLLLLANGDLEIGTLNQILQELGITPISNPGNTLDQATIDRILEQVSLSTLRTDDIIDTVGTRSESTTDQVSSNGNGLRTTATTDCELFNGCLEFIGLPESSFTGVLTSPLLIGFLNVNGPLDSDTLNTFLTCLRLKPNEPARLSTIDPTILSQILNALRIPNKGCEVATSSSTLTIAATAMAALGSLLAAAVPVAIGVVAAYLLLENKRFMDYYDYSDNIASTLHSGYSPSSTYVPPPTLYYPKTYGTPKLQ